MTSSSAARSTFTLTSPTLADLGAGCLSGLELPGPRPVMGMGLSGFMPLYGQPAATPHLPSIPARHPSNGGGASLRKVDEKALCLCVSDATAFMEVLHGAWQPAPS
jgi:hypothetical protein